MASAVLGDHPVGWAERIRSGRRSDIQGLRAVAVGFVVLYHAGLPITGGFVGVDVFFVISGFVITGMLMRELNRSGRINLGQFYIRRFKRLVPALAVTVTFTALVSAFVLSPLGPQQTAAATGVGALAMLANVVITRTTGSYFDAPAETNPLLNTWSLSVEEQFYLAFPTLLLLGWALRRTRGGSQGVAIVVGAVAVVSFALACAHAAQWALPTAGLVAGFYSPFTRAWEFAVGALLALFVTRKRSWKAPEWVYGAAGWVGMVALVLSLWLLGPGVPFPGPMTLVPVLGTALLIFAGEAPGNSATRLLSTKPFVRIGDCSYSLYLWHWPIIVFALVLWPGTWWVAPTAAAASLLPAVASYAVIETRFRHLSLRSPRTTMLFSTLVMAVPLITCSAVWAGAKFYWMPKIEAGNFPFAHEGDVGPEIRSQYLRDRFFPCEISQLPDVYQTDVTCLQSKSDAPIDFAVIGDSHALHLFIGLAEAAPSKNVAAVYLHQWPTRRTANALNTFKEISETSSVEGVLVASAWVQQEPGADAASFLVPLVDAGKAVFVTDDVPDFSFDASACKFRTGFLVGATHCSADATDFAADRMLNAAFMGDIRATVPQVQVLSTYSHFCNNGTCTMTPFGDLLYEDNNHLNAAGSRYVVDRMLRESESLADVLSGRTQK